MRKINQYINRIREREKKERRKREKERSLLAGVVRKLWKGRERKRRGLRLVIESSIRKEEGEESVEIAFVSNGGCHLDGVKLY